MRVELRELSAHEVLEFATESFRTFLEERVKSGEEPAVVAADSNGQFESMFPNGTPRPGHHIWRLEQDAESVGTLWIGPASPDDPATYWVWDIVIDEARRNQGLGKIAMRLAEQQARSLGAKQLGLTVFEHNPIARHLYEQIGYTPVSTRMTKTL